MSDELVEEIDRVIFESHSFDERDGATGFPEFREHRTNRFKQVRIRENGAISDSWRIVLCRVAY